MTPLKLCEYIVAIISGLCIGAAEVGVCVLIYVFVAGIYTLKKRS